MATLSAADITDLVHRLETARAENRLIEALVDPALPSPVVSAYQHLGRKSLSVSRSHRRHVNAVLRTALWPLRPPVVTFRASRGRCPTDSGVEGASCLRVGGSRARFDQALALRYWGIGVVFDEDASLGDYFEERLTAATISTLTSMLRDLDILEHDPFWIAHQDHSWLLPPPQSADFERLICDILNEERTCARHGSLIEDVLEKTDLRVHVPGLERRRGARVQITSTVDPLLYFEKLSKMRHAEELVVLSPASLAIFAQDTGRLDLLNIEGTGIELTAETAQTIQRELRRALSTGRRYRNPLGPMAAVSTGIRQLIREYVEEEAIRSTAQMRHRLSNEGPRDRRRLEHRRRVRGLIPPLETNLSATAAAAAAAAANAAAASSDTGQNPESTPSSRESDSLPSSDGTEPLV